MTIKNITEDLKVHPTRKYNKRLLSRIEYIALHHSGGGGTIEQYAEYHVSKGWPGIGYHYVIDKLGNIFQTNYIDTISYNVGPQNPKVIGICVKGNYDKEKLTEKQKQALINLIGLLRVIVGYKPVKGHYEFKATDCPGQDIKDFIKLLN